MAKGSGMIHPNMATLLGVCILTVILQFFAGSVHIFPFLNIGLYVPGNNNWCPGHKWCLEKDGADCCEQKFQSNNCTEYQCFNPVHINEYRHIRNLIPYLRILHSSGDPVLSTIYIWQSCLFMWMGTQAILFNIVWLIPHLGNYEYYIYNSWVIWCNR